MLHLAFWLFVSFTIRLVLRQGHSLQLLFIGAKMKQIRVAGQGNKILF